MFCILIIFAFDIKLSKFISKIPLLNSVIDSTILETFEKVNENDEFYKSLKTAAIDSNSNGNIIFGADILSTYVKEESDSSSKF
jgi:hypothetical protein